MKAALLAVAVLATAGVAFYFSPGVHAAKANLAKAAAHPALSSKSLPLPLFFEPNQGQAASQVKFLSRGAGYGLFLTADEAVLQLRHVGGKPSAEPSSNSVIRMHLEGANASPRVSGASPLPGKSSYFIGSDPSKWQRDIPQFGRVQYQAVYPGIDLVYYGDQGQLEYDFRVAPSADPSEIALSFKGATARIDSASSGDLVLSTANGDVRFRAPHIYQPDGNSQKAVAGSFRQLADNKIGFTIGDYDHNRELVIDPILTYSTFLGGSAAEGLVKVAFGPDGLIYLAGSTNSTNFPITTGSNTVAGAQNIFISKINPLLSGTSQLVYSIILGGTGSSEIDSLAGIAVDSHANIYVAGSTNSTNFPPTPNAFQQSPAVPGTHGFLSRISFNNLAYSLTYSTYLAGNGTDHVTGLAVDNSSQYAYVTGDTTSQNPASDGFPANPNGFQLCPFGPIQSGGVCPVASGPPQFFASKINTTGSGSLSMIYSTYFGGGNPAGATAVGGGIAVDQTNSNVSMYITGTTNMLPTAGPNGEAKFPLFNAQQSCLNEASNHATCTGANTTNTDAFVAKINPNQPGSNPAYSTYLGGSGIEAGIAIAVDTTGSAYVTGSTTSGDWVSCNGLQCIYNGGGNPNAFVAKIGSQSGSLFPITYFTYLGGGGPDSGQDIKVDSVFSAHVVGNTSSVSLPFVNPIQPTALSTYNGSVYGGQGDAFVAQLNTGSSSTGDYLTYLGGSQTDHGTGIAIDSSNSTYVAGDTLSSNFPTVNPYNAQLNSGSQDAFVTKIGPATTLALTVATNSPRPNPVNAGSPAAFVFNIQNLGPDVAASVSFTAIVPTIGVSSQAAKFVSGTGTCGPLTGNTFTCTILNLAATATAAVEVDVTPLISGNLNQLLVTATASADGGALQGPVSQTVPVVDFKMSAVASPQTITAGDSTTVQVSLCPTDPSLGYTGTITPTQTTSPSMVTATAPTFIPTPVPLTGTSCATTALTIATVARPIPTGSLLRHGSFYATWLPIGGLSLVGLGFGAARKRRRWLAGAVLCVIGAAVLLQVGCGNSSSSVSPTGGTVAQNYTVTINGSAGTGGSHSTQVTIRVN